MATVTITDYLVALGFKIDEKGLKDFETSLDKSAKSVKNLVKGIAAATLAIGAGVTKFAQSLDTLYQESRKTNATVVGIKALEKTAVSLGTTAGTATSALEGLAQKLRTSSGYEAAINSMGVATRKANGDMLKTEQIMLNLSKHFQNVPYARAVAEGNVLGIPEDMVRVMQDPNFGVRFAEYAKTLSKMDFQGGAKSAHEFMEILRDLQTRIEVIGAKIGVELIKRFGPDMEAAVSWLDKNLDRVVNGILDFIKTVAQLVNTVAPAVKAIVDWFLQMDKATGGLSTKILLLGGAFMKLGGASILGALGSVLGLLGKIGNAAMLASGSVLSLGLKVAQVGQVGVAGMAGYEVGQHVVAPLIDKGLSAITGRAMSLGTGLYDLFHPGSQDLGMPTMPKSAQKGAQTAPERAEESKKRVVQPLSDAEARAFLGRLEKDHGLPPGVLHAQWKAESSGGKNMRSAAGAEGHFQFMPNTAKAMGVSNPYDFYDSAKGAARYMEKLYKQSNGDLGKALASYNWGPGNVQKYGLAAMPAETRNYNRRVMDEMHNGGTTVNQTNNVNITGVTSPHETGAAVKEALGHATAAIVSRNTSQMMR